MKILKILFTILLVLILLSTIIGIFYLVEFKKDDLTPVNTPQIEIVKTKKIKHSTLKVPIDNIIPIKGEISSQSSELLSQLIITGTDKGDPVYLVIDSFGGSVFAGRQIIEGIEAANGPVYTICVNYCASMAAMIFQYGKLRYITPSSQLMYHPAYGAVKGNIDIMATEVASLKKYIDIVESFVAARVGMTLTQYKNESASKNIYLDAEDAVKRKFADKIVYLQYVK